MCTTCHWLRKVKFQGWEARLRVLGATCWLIWRLQEQAQQNSSLGPGFSSDIVFFPGGRKVLEIDSTDALHLEGKP